MPIGQECHQIEKGTTDPTFGMLTRLLAAAGHELHATSRARHDAPATLASIPTAVEAGSDRLRIDWTRLRAFADWCRRHPGDVGAAIADPPRRTGTAFDAILAAVAELLAERSGVSTPPWTRSVPMVGGSWLLWHTQRAATYDVDSAKRLDPALGVAASRVSARHDLGEAGSTTVPPCTGLPMPTTSTARPHTSPAA
jgi:hypothetical protein